MPHALTARELASTFVLVLRITVLVSRATFIWENYEN